MRPVDAISATGRQKSRPPSPEASWRKLGTVETRHERGYLSTSKSGLKARAAENRHVEAQLDVHEGVSENSAAFHGDQKYPMRSRIRQFLPQPPQPRALKPSAGSGSLVVRQAASILPVIDAGSFTGAFGDVGQERGKHIGRFHVGMLLQIVENRVDV